MEIIAKKTIYTCDLHLNGDGNPEEIDGMMYEITLSTQHQGQEQKVTVDACQECKDRYFPIRS